MYTLAELAKLIGAEIIGDAQAQIRRANSFEAAESGDVTFAADRTYRSRLAQSNATAIIIAPPVVETSSNLLIVKNPKLAFARVVQLLHQPAYQPTGISEDFIKGGSCILGNDLSIYPRVTLGHNVVIGNRVTLHPGVVIGDGSQIGDDTIIYANVSIYHNCEIGKRVIIHAGTVIGADGFGFVPDETGRQVKLLQLSRIIIEDDCEIGANCAIDRGGFDDTILRRGVKLDNLIQVGHGSEIGENTVVAALAGFSGGTRIGRNCIIAGQVGTNQHVTIGDGALITGQAGVTRDIPAGARISGMSQDLQSWRRSQVLYSRLPEIHERLKQVERIAKNLRDKEESSDCKDGVKLGVIMSTTIEPAVREEILQKLQSLSPEKQQEVLDFVEFLSEKEKAANVRRSVKGMLSHLNIKISKAEIDEARREVWGKFYDDSSSREEK